MRIFKTFLVFIIVACLFGCYEPSGNRTILPSNIEWTGAGDYASGSSFRGIAMGLAGQDAYWFGDNGSVNLHSNVLAGEFLGPYQLTSVAQTFSLGWHEQSFMHGNLVGQTNNLDLFHTVQAFFGHTAAHRIAPLNNLTLLQDGLRYNVVEICDMATPDQASGWVLPYHSNSHLLMSVRACTSSGSCAGGVIEAAIDTSKRWWWIKSTAGVQHASIKRLSGARYSNECMPISATRWSGFDSNTVSDEFLFVGDPSTDEITVFDAQDLKRGPVDALRLPSSKRIKDLTVEGVQSGAVHFSFLAVLWQNGTGNTLEHYQVVDGNLPSSAFLTENLGAGIDLVQSFGRGYRNSQEGTGDVLTLGNRVVRRSYRKR